MVQPTVLGHRSRQMEEPEAGHIFTQRRELLLDRRIASMIRVVTKEIAKAFNQPD